VSLCLTKHHAVKTYRGMEIELLSFLTSALDWGDWWASSHGRFTSGKRIPGTHGVGGWLGRGE